MVFEKTIILYVLIITSCLLRGEPRSFVFAFFLIFMAVGISNFSQTFSGFIIIVEMK